MPKVTARKFGVRIGRHGADTACSVPQTLRTNGIGTCNAADCRFKACAARLPRAYLQVYERVLAGETLHEQHPVIQGEARDLAWSD